MRITLSCIFRWTTNSENPVLAAVASRVFNAMFREILNAFEQRAAKLFPDRNSAGAAHTRR